MFRLIAVALFLLIFLLISYPLFLIEWIVGKFSPKARDISSLRIVQWAFGVIKFLGGIKVTVKGRENIPEEPALFVGNHRSFFDAVITYPLFKNLTGFLAKKSIDRIPSLRIWMRFVKCVFIDRDDLKSGMKAILKCIDLIKSGISVVIFPEARRNPGEELSVLAFREGSFKVATKTGCPVVPVAINNSAAIFESHMPWIKKTHVIVEFAKPIYPKDLTKEEQKTLGARSRGIIEDTLKKNADLTSHF